MAVVGQSLAFGITSDQASLVTQKFSVSQKVDKKEAKDKGGRTVAVAYYNKQSEISVEGLGASSSTPGASLSLTSPPVAPVGTVFVEQVDVDSENEDFVKSTIKANAWEGITS